MVLNIEIAQVKGFRLGSDGEVKDGEGMMGNPLAELMASAFVSPNHRGEKSQFGSTDLNNADLWTSATRNLLC